MQRSVANNLNDIGKDHPDVVVETCRRWANRASPDVEWIIRHACRSLVKRRHPGALDLLGVGATPEVRLDRVRIEPRAVRLGEASNFSFRLTSAAREEQALLVDYAVHFVKARGETRPKVFKLKKLRLRPGERAELSGKVSLQSMTTRRHYPGTHLIELIVNGVSMSLGAFDLRP